MPEVKEAPVKKATKKAVKAAIPVMALPGCKACGKELTKLLFNSREGNLYVHVCNHPECELYRHFQGHEGDIPEGLRLVEI